MALETEPLQAPAEPIATESAAADEDVLSRLERERERAQAALARHSLRNRP